MERGLCAPPLSSEERGGTKEDDRQYRPPPVHQKTGKTSEKNFVSPQDLTSGSRTQSISQRRSNRQGSPNHSYYVSRNSDDRGVTEGTPSIPIGIGCRRKRIKKRKATASGESRYHSSRLLSARSRVKLLWRDDIDQET